MDEKFNKYISKVKKLNYVNDEDKLFLYAHYKQALNGDNNIEKPSIFNRIDMAKWKAWNELQGITKDDAIKNYIKKVKELYASV